jgi:thiamine pyrophosphokinase
MRFLRVHAHAIMSQENPALSDNHDLYMTTTHRSVTKTQQQKKKKLDVVVLGGLGGRVDQGFSQIHHLYVAHAQRREISSTMSADEEDTFCELYILSEESL